MNTYMDIDALASAAMGGFPQPDPEIGVDVFISEASGGAPRTLAQMGRQATLTQIYRAAELQANSQMARIEEADAAADVQMEGLNDNQSGGAPPSRPGNWRSSVTSVLGETRMQLEAKLAKALASRAHARAKRSSTMPQIPYFQATNIDKFDAVFILCALNMLIKSVDSVVKNDDDVKARIDECLRKMNVSDAAQRLEFVDKEIANNIKTDKGVQWKAQNGSKIVGTVHAEFGKIFVHLVTQKNGDGTFTKEFWPEVSTCFLEHMDGLAPTKGGSNSSEGPKEPKEALTSEQKEAKKAAKKVAKKAEAKAAKDAMTDEQRAQKKKEYLDAMKKGKETRKRQREEEQEELLELQQWKEDNEEAVAQANNMDELYTTLSDSFDRLEEKYLEVNQTLTERQKERDDLKEERDTFKEERDELKGELSSIQEELEAHEELEKQLAELQAKNEELEKQLAELKAEGAPGAKRPRTRGGTK